MTTKTVCDACGRVFSNPNSLKQHFKTHSEVKPFECSTCKKTFRYRQSFQEHLKRHKKLKTVQCDICGKRFYTHRELNPHMKLHLPSSQYHCSQCNLYFKEDKSLKAHCNKQHITKYKCCYCPAVFSNRKVWKSHEFRNHVHKKEKLHFQENVNEKKMTNLSCNQTLNNKLTDKSHLVIQHGLEDGTITELNLVNQSPKKWRRGRENILKRKYCADNSTNLNENNQDVKHRENVNDQKQFKGETGSVVKLNSDEHINSKNVHSGRTAQQASSLHSSKMISCVENEQFELQQIADVSYSKNIDERSNLVGRDEFQTISGGHRHILENVNNEPRNQVKRHRGCEQRTSYISSDLLNNEESCKFYANPLAKFLSYENTGDWRPNAEHREIVKPNEIYDSDYESSLRALDDKTDDITSDSNSDDKNQTHYAVFINDEPEESQTDNVQGSVELDVNNITVYSDDNETYEEMQHEFDEFDEQFKTDVKSGFSCSCKVRDSSEALQKYFENSSCRNRSQCTAKVRLDSANADESRNTDRDSPKAFQTYFAKCAQPNKSLKECRPRESCEAFQKYFEKYSIQGSFENVKTQDMQHTNLIHSGPSSVTDILPCFVAATKCTLSETNTENVGDICNNESIIVDTRRMRTDMNDKALDLSNSKNNSACLENSSLKGSSSSTDTERINGKLPDKNRCEISTRLCEQTTANGTLDISDKTAVYKTATHAQEEPYRYDKLFLVPKIPEKRIRRSKVIKTVNSVENMDTCLSERNVPTPLLQGLSADRLPSSQRKVSVCKNKLQTTCYDKEENKDKQVACGEKAARKPTSIFRTDKNGTRILIGIIDPNKRTTLPSESKDPTVGNEKIMESSQAPNTSARSVDKYLSPSYASYGTHSLNNNQVGSVSQVGVIQDLVHPMTSGSLAVSYDKSPTIDNSKMNNDAYSQYRQFYRTSGTVVNETLKSHPSRMSEEVVHVKPDRLTNIGKSFAPRVDFDVSVEGLVAKTLSIDYRSKSLSNCVKDVYHQNLQSSRSVDENSDFIVPSSPVKEIGFSSGHLDRLSCPASNGHPLHSFNTEAANANSVNHDTKNNYRYVAHHYSNSGSEKRTNEFPLKTSVLMHQRLGSSSDIHSLTLKRADEFPSTTKLFTPVSTEFQTASSLQPKIPDIQSRTRSTSHHTDTRVIDYSRCSTSNSYDVRVCVPEQITELEDSLKETLIKLRNKSGYKALLGKMFDLVQAEQSYFE